MSIDMSAPSVRKKSFARSSKPSVRMCFREQRDSITMSSPEVCWPPPMRAIGAQNLLTMPGGVSTSGYLHKKGGSQFSLMKWPLRYIIIHKGCVYYFKSSTSPTPQGAFSLNGYNRVMRAAEETTSSNVFPFKIVHFSKKHRTWFFSAASEDERRKWMRLLRREIDHYNDRKESHIPSDPDADADSFYGTIEKPMDIKNPHMNADDEYTEEEDDDDEEDYLKPDSECPGTPTGRPTGPPPSYPPPPVPSVSPHRQDSSPGCHKGPPPSLPPQVRLHKKPVPSVPPSSISKEPIKELPPLPPSFVPQSHNSLSSNFPPILPPPNPKRTLQNRLTSIGDSGNDKKDCKPPLVISVLSPATLPICEQVETRLKLNGPNLSSLNIGGSQSLGNNHLGGISNFHSKPTAPAPHSTNTGASIHPQLFPAKPGLPNKLVLPKPPPPGIKPPLPPTKTKQPAPPIQRASPEGQSFRSSADETSSDFRKKRETTKHGGGHNSDEDYENVQLPESVFINTTETSIVEKLFREGPTPPQDGLYGIRNSGTKTSKVLVVWDEGISKARNYRLFQEDNCIFLDREMTFPTLAALIEHYYSHPLPHHGSLCLQQPFT